MNARLALEDGSLFRGRGFAGPVEGVVTGEVVFNTAMTGYQEALTDPSYAGQILVMTATQIGNYGICDADVESARVQVAGFVVRERSRVVSNHRAQGDLANWLDSGGICAMDGLDTRALVRRLREAGAMRGAITNDPSISDRGIVEAARSSVAMAGRNLAAEASPRTGFDWQEPLGSEWWPTEVDASGRPALRVLAIDCGAKRNIYRHLVARGCTVRAIPFDSDAEAIRGAEADGLFISNGPGDPAAVEQTIATLREVAGEIPTFGICLGHQLLALALGAATSKLKFGHRGANQPVRDVRDGHIEITSQNHGFCVDAGSLPSDCEVTHLHLNDGTVAGFRHRTKPILAVQYHPEASPGPHDSSRLFDEFVAMMHARRSATEPATA